MLAQVTARKGQSDSVLVPKGNYKTLLVEDSDELLFSRWLLLIGWNELHNPPLEKGKPFVCWWKSWCKKVCIDYHGGISGCGVGVGERVVQAIN
jgi:hypothetical protein